MPSGIITLIELKLFFRGELSDLGS